MVHCVVMRERIWFRVVMPQRCCNSNVVAVISVCRVDVCVVLDRKVALNRLGYHQERWEASDAGI